MSARRQAHCEQCGEVRELATRTECFNCYRRRTQNDVSDDEIMEVILRGRN